MFFAGGRHLRVQGEHDPAWGCGNALRKTPARVGGTSALRRSAGDCAEDPCACRGNYQAGYVGLVVAGRPLRVQEEPGCDLPTLTRGRKTPARAGGTSVPLDR